MRLSAGGGDFAATVRRAMFLGNIAEYPVEVDGIGSWLVDSPNPGETGLFEPGARVFVSPSRSSIHVPG